MTNFALISDVHSQARLLVDALDYCHNHNLIPLFLGDLWDSRNVESNSVQVYHLVKQAIASGGICIQSNHQDKHIRYLKGNNVFIDIGLEKTLSDFKNSDITNEELYEFLTSLPYGVVFRNSDGVEHRVAHAYFSSKIKIPSYDDYHLIYDVDIDRKIKSSMLYGPIDRETRQRIEWWNTPKQNDYVLVSGHYHKVFIDIKSIVLDGGAGGPEENAYLALYDVNKKILKKFY
jgi:hypothetical protein